MILIYAILAILIQPILEAVQNAYKPEWNPVVRKLNPVTRLAIASVWFFAVAIPFDDYYVPIWKLITGYVFVAFMIYDTVWNLTSIICGKKISIWYYGDSKWYDRVMTQLAEWGWMMKAILGIVGIIHLWG